jgi:hypothetical protein
MGLRCSPLLASTLRRRRDGESAADRAGSALCGGSSSSRSAARVSRRGVGERAWDLGMEKVTDAQPGPLSLSLRATMARGGPFCPVPGDAWRAATAVLSTVMRKKMRCEKTILPLVGMRNHQDSHRALLFGSVTTASHVHSVADLRVPRKAGPQISDCAGTSRRAMGG